MDTTAATGNGIDCSPLVNINDDCLREIFKYLNVFNAVKVASTCKRLRYFANENYYPKFIKFELKPDVKDKELPITGNFLRTMLEHFGTIVEEIDVHGAALTDFGCFDLQSVFELCPNLHTLRIRNFQFGLSNMVYGHLAEYRLAKGGLTELFLPNGIRPNTVHPSNVSNVSSKIKVLEICECVGTDNLWLGMISNFHELRSLSITSKINLGAFISKLRNLNSLELHEYYVSEFEFKTFCENNGSTMRNLKLMRCETILIDSLFRLITSKLPEIEELTIVTHFGKFTNQNLLNCLSQLSHLKKLVIGKRDLPLPYNVDIGRCMQLLGNRGLLELLDICGGALDAETCGALKNFQRLQTLRFSYPVSEYEYMMDILVEADLPELREFYCEACDSITNANLVTMVTSKRNLTTVDILCNKNVTFTAVRKLINVLKSDVDGDRPHLKLNIDTIEMGEEEKKVLNANRHLISVTNVSSKIEYSSSTFNRNVDSDDDYYDDNEDLYRRPLYGYFDYSLYSNDNYDAFYEDAFY